MYMTAKREELTLARLTGSNNNNNYYLGKKNVKISTKNKEYLKIY